MAEADPALAARMKLARERAGFQPSYVAERLGVSKQAVSKWETGTSTPAAKRFQIIAMLYDVNVDWLVSGRGAPDAPLNNLQLTSNAKERQIGMLEAVALPDRLSMRKDVRVVRVYVEGAMSGFTLTDEADDLVRRPPGLEMAKMAYAIYVPNGEMAPRYERGELVYIDPRRPAQDGDYVLIQVRGNSNGDPARGFIRRLERLTETQAHCEQFSPLLKDIFELSDIVAIHRIPPWTELLGL